MTHLKNWRGWAWGFLGAMIGGGATAATSWLGMAGANAAGMRVSVPNLTEVWIIFASSAIVSGLAYLKSSPLPVLVEEETTFITKTTTKTPAEPDTQ